MARRRRSFGEISEIPSRVPGRPARYRARYWGPDGVRHKASTTFEFRGDAEGFLRTVQQQIYLNVWTPPADETPAAEPAAVLSFGVYAEQCITHRETRPRRPLRLSTAALYRKLMRLELAGTFGDLPVGQITPAAVKAWHAVSSGRGKPTQTGNAYLFLKSVLNDAVDEGLIESNPCKVKGAGKPERARAVVALTAAELNAYVAAVPERHRLPLALAGWCGLRSGEVRGLRVSDYDRDSGALTVAQAVARIDGRVIVGAPKTAAGKRTVYVPPHVRPMVLAWLAGLPVRGRDALMFPARDDRSPLNASTLRDAHTKAAAAIDRPTMTLHDLRRTALTLAAQRGATVSELMRMAGHTTPNVAMLYQSAADERMAAIAARMSE